MEWAMASSAMGPIGRPMGAIDDAACPGFLDLLRQGVGHAADSRSDFILDLGAVDHIAANGLLAMTLARKEAVTRGVKIILACPNDLIREVLEISRYQLIFEIVDTLEPDDR